MRWKVLKQVRIPQPYVINEIAYGLIKAVLKMGKSGIEEDDIKNIYICRKITTFIEKKKESNGGPKVTKYSTVRLCIEIYLFASQQSTDQP